MNIRLVRLTRIGRICEAKDRSGEVVYFIPWEQCMASYITRDNLLDNFEELNEGEVIR